MIDFKLYIIRGLPGSGKSTLGNTLLAAGLVHYSIAADDFMVDEHGKYKFDSAKLSFCHKQCLNSCEAALMNGYRIAVCNTFTRIWEMQPYLNLPYSKTVIKTEGNYGSTHNVPIDTMNSMTARFENYHGKSS